MVGFFDAMLLLLRGVGWSLSPKPEKGVGIVDAANAKLRGGWVKPVPQA